MSYNQPQTNPKNNQTTNQPAKPVVPEQMADKTKIDTTANAKPAAKSCNS